MDNKVHTAKHSVNARVERNNACPEPGGETGSVDATVPP